MRRWLHGPILALLVAQGACIDEGVVGDQSNMSPGGGGSSGSEPLGDAGRAPDAASVPNPNAPEDAGPPGTDASMDAAVALDSGVRDSGAPDACPADAACGRDPDCGEQSCIPCTEDSTCPGSWPYCDDGHCVECLTHFDCASFDCELGFCDND